jgi:hypothetical protein
MSPPMSVSKTTGIFPPCAADVLLETAQLSVSKHIVKIPRCTAHPDFDGRANLRDSGFVKKLVLFIVYPPDFKDFYTTIMCKYTDNISFVESIFKKWACLYVISLEGRKGSFMKFFRSLAHKKTVLFEEIVQIRRRWKINKNSYCDVKFYVVSGCFSFFSR